MTITRAYCVLRTATACSNEEIADRPLCRLPIGYGLRSGLGCASDQPIAGTGTTRLPVYCASVAVKNSPANPYVHTATCQVNVEVVPSRPSGKNEQSTSND